MKDHLKFKTLELRKGMEERYKITSEMKKNKDAQGSMYQMKI